MLRAFWLPAVLVALASPSPAAAHGRFPESHGVTFHPADPNVIVVGTTFGPVQSTDGGETWRWACEAALMLNPLEDPTYLLLGDGSLVASGFGGLQRSDASLCRFDEPDMDVGFAITDVARSTEDMTTAYAPTSAGGTAVNGVFRSTDGGASWEPTSEPIEAILFESLVVGPGDFLYLSGIYPITAERSEPDPYVHRSFDAGATWERFAFPFEDTDRTFLLLGVDPTTPERVFGRVLIDHEIDRDEKLVRSEDGGETWETVATHREIGGLVFAPDGTLYVGAEFVPLPSDPTMPVVSHPYGLFRSDDGGETFVQLRDDLDVGCLGWHEGTLWACGDAYRDGFMLAQSFDGGATFEPRLRLGAMSGPVVCDEGDRTPVACEVRDQDIFCDFAVVPPMETLMCDGAVFVPDGGLTGDSPGGGCDCAAGGDGGSVPLLLLLLALTARRRSLYHPG